jgi:predicted peptidase
MYFQNESSIGLHNAPTKRNFATSFENTGHTMTKTQRVLSCTFLFSSALLASQCAAAQSPQQALATTVQMQIRYLAYFPKSYSAKGAPVPLLVFLHGSGESGDDLEKVKVWGPPAMIDKGVEFPFMVVSPQAQEHQGWNAKLLMAMLDDVLAKYNVDRKRVYLTGLSMGGFGTWELATLHPEYFAAIAPIAGGWDPSEASRLKGVPIWVFHGKKDDVVPESGSAAMVDALKAIGSDVKYTVLPEGGHVDSWVYAYEKAGLFDWFLQHHKP